MQSKIKIKVGKLNNYIRHLDKSYCLNKTSPLLFRSIKEFILRKGKRIRPIFFIIGYRGFAKGPAANLNKTAFSFELLHDFLLVHDDIIDKANTRRGKPSMHRVLAGALSGYKNIKFNGEDLAIIAADVLYAMAFDAFLSIKVDLKRKEKALRKFIQAAVFTGMGEFIELLNGIKDIKKLTPQDIYKIYDYKTGYYTFSSPLTCGAILAGADERKINKLHQYGIYLGRAFQIKDDILGIFGPKKKMGKSTLTDLQEAKKTILIWYAYHKTNAKDRLTIKRIFVKSKVEHGDLLKIRKIITESGALEYAQEEITRFARKARNTIHSLRMRRKYKRLLNKYSQELLKL